MPSLAFLSSLRTARKTYHLDAYRLPLAAMAAGCGLRAAGFVRHDGLTDVACACATSIGRTGDAAVKGQSTPAQITPSASMASATRKNPQIFAPAT